MGGAMEQKYRRVAVHLAVMMCITAVIILWAQNAAGLAICFNESPAS